MMTCSLFQLSLSIALAFVPASFRDAINSRDVILLHAIYSS